MPRYFLPFSAYRRTNMPAFAFLIWASLLSVILEMGLHLRTPTSSEDALSFHEWYKAGFLASCILWGIGVFQLIQYVRREFEQKSPPNTALEPTAAAPSVSDVPGNPKVSDSSTSASGGGGSALDR